MKKSILQGILIFTAGACVAGGALRGFEAYNGDVERFRADGDELLQQIAHRGMSVISTGETRTNISMIDGACVRPPPTPNLPANVVDLRVFERGVASLRAQLTANMVGDERPVVAFSKCWVSPEEMK
jgi:hypothetical protein